MSKDKPPDYWRSEELERRKNEDQTQRARGLDKGNFIRPPGSFASGNNKNTTVLQDLTKSKKEKEGKTYAEKEKDKNAAKDLKVQKPGIPQKKVKTNKLLSRIKRETNPNIPKEEKTKGDVVKQEKSKPNKMITKIRKEPAVKKDNAPNKTPGKNPPPKKPSGRTK